MRVACRLDCKHALHAFRAVHGSPGGGCRAAPSLRCQASPSRTSASAYVICCKKQQSDPIACEQAVRAIGRCAVTLERAAERCINVLLDLIKQKVNYVVQEAVVVITDIFRRYPNRYALVVHLLHMLCVQLEACLGVSPACYVARCTSLPCLLLYWFDSRGCREKQSLVVPWHTLSACLSCKDGSKSVRNARCARRYETIIATLCDSLDSLDEPEARAAMVWIIGEYAERIDNADELLESFLEVRLARPGGALRSLKDLE